MRNSTKPIVFVFLVLGFIFVAYLNFSKFENVVKNVVYTYSQRCNKYFGNKQQRELLGFSSYSPDLKSKLQNLLARNALALDPELISFVQEVIDYPAPPNQIKMSRRLMRTPQATIIDEILEKKKYGFFVEAGGLDGERSSNTIWLEKVRGWTGLLVEPDPLFYTQLMGKNRNAWSINGCVSPYNYISEIPFKFSLGGNGKLDFKNDSRFPQVPCYPLLTLLTAIDVSHVDFFSLDVEGAEGDILESLPVDKLDISTLAVEYIHGNKARYLKLMKKKGYKVVKELHVNRPTETLFVDDFIFAKRGLRIPMNISKF